MTRNQPASSETDPLLPRPEEERARPGSIRHDDEGAAQMQVPELEDDRTTKERLAIAIPCLVLLLFLEFGSVMMNVALNEVTEGIICRNFFGDVLDPKADTRCKGTLVQTELAVISGWEMSFQLLPSLLTGIPYGLAADRYGRRAVLMLANVGFVLGSIAIIVVCQFPETFPIRLRWVAPLFCFIGGGPSTYTALMFTMVSDITTQAQRSSAFFVLGTAMTAGGLVAGPLTFLIMRLGSAWLCIFCGFGLLVMTLPITAFLPESRCAAVVKRAKLARQAAAGNQGVARSRWDMRPVFRSVRAQVSLIVRVLFMEKPIVGVLLFSTSFTIFGRGAAMLLLQYITKRFGWSWEQAALVSTAQDVASLILMAIVLPSVSYMLLQTGMASLVKDWWLVRASAVIGAVGALSMGLSPTAPVFVVTMTLAQFGTGMMLALRSLLTELVDQTHVALLMTVLSAFATVSDIFAGPLIAQLFHVGMEWGGMWIGMPYFAASAALSVGAAMVIFAPIGRHVRLRTRTTAEED